MYPPRPSEFAMCGIMDVYPVPSEFVIVPICPHLLMKKLLKSTDSWKISEANCDVLSMWEQMVFPHNYGRLGNEQMLTHTHTCKHTHTHALTRACTCQPQLECTSMWQRLTAFA